MDMAGALLVICVLLVNPVSHIVFAVRIGLSLQKLASGMAEQNLAVKEAKDPSPGWDAEL